jgi:purine-nucleoside phosphorylase
MLIRDHLNMMGTNPLIGQNDSRFGVRFPDMTEVYSREYQQIVDEEAKKIATEKGIPSFLKRGIYCALTGPNYETPAEIRMFRLLGADAVGMSTVPEAIAAKHQGMNVIGISCITNLAAGVSDDTINHEEVMETGEKVAAVFKELLVRVLLRISQ